MVAEQVPVPIPAEDSIRINQQWRVCFRWRDGAAHDADIVDYR